ncbi:hypothetical protein D3C76_1797140 [compost metagenome]
MWIEGWSFFQATEPVMLAISTLLKTLASKSFLSLFQKPNFTLPKPMPLMDALGIFSAMASLVSSLKALSPMRSTIR